MCIRDRYTRLQKEQQAEQKKQSETLKRMQQSYENRINELSSQAVQGLRTNKGNFSNENEEDYDVFVSHAWEDKKEFVDEFVQALRDCGIRVWYDTTQMKWGDSMRAKIDDGLKLSLIHILDALAASENKPKRKPSAPVKPLLTDYDAIRRLMAKGETDK